MSKKNISQEKIIQAFIASAFEKSAGGTSLADISESLEIKKASLYNHFSSRDEMYTAESEIPSLFLSSARLSASRAVKHTYVTRHLFVHGRYQKRFSFIFAQRK